MHRQGARETSRSRHTASGTPNGTINANNLVCSGWLSVRIGATACQAPNNTQRKSPQGQTECHDPPSSGQMQALVSSREIEPLTKGRHAAPQSNLLGQAW